MGGDGMILLLPGNAKGLLNVIRSFPQAYGWLLTPRRTMTRTGLYGLLYAVDNECFTLGSDFDPDRYRRALRRIAEIHGTGTCLFATAPDVVGDAQATLERAREWLPEIRSLGFPAALVAQDGLENLEIPWSDFDALFVGGTTAWKLGPAAAYLVKEAKRRGKWTHIGRINSVHRAARLLELPDSVDGTAWAKHPAHYAGRWQCWLDAGMPSFVGAMF